MKRGLFAAVLIAGVALWAGAYPALAASVEGARSVPAPAAEKTSLRSGSGARVKKTVRRGAKQSLTTKRRRAIGEGAPLEVKHSLDGSAATAPTVLKQLRVVMRAIRNHDERRRGGMSGARLRALALVDSRPGLKVGEFARELGVHQSTASNLLEQLARQGLVEKRRNGEDQRGVSLFATEDAKALLEGRTRTEAMQQALDQLPPSTLEALHGHLVELIKLMRVTDFSAARAMPLSGMPLPDS